MNELLYGDNAQEMKAVATGPNQTYRPLDQQLVDEFVGRCLFVKRDEPRSSGLNTVPWSQIDAVLRRLGVEF